MLFVRKETLLAVLSALLSSSVFVFAVHADVGSGTSGDERDIVSASSRRQLKPKSKKSKKTDSPTAMPPLFLSFPFLIVETSRTTIDATTTTGTPPNTMTEPSFIGTQSIQMADIYDEECIILDDDGIGFEIICPEPTGTYSRTSQVDSGVFPVVETQSSSLNLCFPQPTLGGCIFLKSGGEFNFDIIDSESPPPGTYISSGANTGVVFFGVEWVAVETAIGSRAPAGGVEVNRLDLTVVFKEDLPTIIQRNMMLGELLPGFIPQEGLPLEGTRSNGASSFPFAALLP